jgi:hypothetical protein
MVERMVDRMVSRMVDRMLGRTVGMVGRVAGIRRMVGGMVGGMVGRTVGGTVGRCRCGFNQGGGEKIGKEAGCQAWHACRVSGLPRIGAGSVWFTGKWPSISPPPRRGKVRSGRKKENELRAHPYLSKPQRLLQTQITHLPTHEAQSRPI